MLKFFDETEVGLIGLDDIMAELYSEGRKPTDETAEVIIKRLEERNNYIPPSERVRKEYAYALLKEYRMYVKERSCSGSGHEGK
jgi:Ca2+-binding EF-hand superfamily protein